MIEDWFDPLLHAPHARLFRIFDVPEFGNPQRSYPLNIFVSFEKGVLRNTPSAESDVSVLQARKANRNFGLFHGKMRRNLLAERVEPGSKI